MDLTLPTDCGDDNGCYTSNTALVSTFHIPETKNGLIDIYTKMGKIVNKFEEDVRGKDPDQSNDARFKYVAEFNELKIGLLKLKGSPKFGTNQLNPPPPAGQVEHK
jgi:hypothetical protein